MLAIFLKQAKTHGNDWACELVSRLIAIVGETTPDTWGVEVNKEEAPAVFSALLQGEKVAVGDLNKNHLDRKEKLHVMVLMVSRKDEASQSGARLITLPDEDFQLQTEDQILFCSREGERSEISWVLNNSNALHYVQTGEQVSEGWMWRVLSGRQRGAVEES